MGYMLVLEFAECFSDMDVGSCGTWNFKVCHYPMSACVSCHKKNLYRFFHQKTPKIKLSHFSYVAKFSSKSYLSSIKLI
jgi:hypothetical protein